ncbi:hypothetical protein [Sabulibacter ruber]|uniref:hypothetical protein n=1 Tax=Sabulibacter ruber TaxID=2811901 RepID=UPI001A970354|nr:hypothetical protein [Sabulibacter ruber]
MLTNWNPNSCGEKQSKTVAHQFLFALLIAFSAFLSSCASNDDEGGGVVDISEVKITSLNKNQYFPGETMVIKGEGFGTDVTVGFCKGNNCRIVSAKRISGQELEVALGNEIVTGEYTVQVTSHDRISDKVAFKFFAKAPATITSVDPVLIRFETDVRSFDFVVRGTNFLPDADAYQVALEHNGKVFPYVKVKSATANELVLYLNFQPHPEEIPYTINGVESTIRLSIGGEIIESKFKAYPEPRVMSFGARPLKVTPNTPFTLEVYGEHFDLSQQLFPIRLGLRTQNLDPVQPPVFGQVTLRQENKINATFENGLPAGVYYLSVETNGQVRHWTGTATSWRLKVE